MNILTRRIREKNFMSNTMKENKMGTMPVNKLLINMALPMMISMLVQALYNIVDSIFVARISEEALTAVSMAFPMQNLMIGVAGGVGVGTNALLSRALGEGSHIVTGGNAEYTFLAYDKKGNENIGTIAVSY